MTRTSPRLSPKERLIVHRARTRPGWTTRNVLGVKLSKDQQAILHSAFTEIETAARSGHAIGKSLTAACVIVEYAVTHPGCKVIITAPTHRQVVNIIFPEIRALCARSKVKLTKTAPLETKWAVDADGDPNWFVLGFATKENDPSKFQGQHAKSGDILIVVDEACGMSRQIMDEGVSALMTSAGARVLKIGNPTDASSAFYNDFKRAGVRQFVIPSTSTDNFTSFGITLADICADTWREKITGPYPRPYLATPEWVARHFVKCDRDVNHPDFRARVLAEFPETSTDMLVSLALFEAAALRFQATRVETTDLSNLIYMAGLARENRTPLILGVDVARRGTDSTVVYARQGRRAWPVKKIRAQDGNAVAGEVRELVRTMGADAAHIDVIGIGASVIDALSGCDWAVACNSSERADESDRFINKRAEAYWAVRTAFVTGGIDIDDAAAKEQLTKTKYKYARDGRFQIEEKDAIKARLGYSPDEADALSLTFYPSAGWLWR